MKFSIYFIYSFLLFANIKLFAQQKPNLIGLEQDGIHTTTYNSKNVNSNESDTAILVSWPLNKNGQPSVAGIVTGKVINNRFVVERRRVSLGKSNVSEKLGDILIDDVPIPFERVGGGDSQGDGIPIDTAILIKWPPIKSGNKFTSVSTIVTGYIQNGDFIFVQQSRRIIPTSIGKIGDILINDVEIPFEKKNNGPKVEDDAIIKVQSEKKTTNTKPKQETATLGEISAKWDKTKNPYGIVVFKNSQFVYDKAENIQEWMRGNKKLKGKKEKGYEAYYIIPTTPKDTTIQAANGAGTRLAAGESFTKPGLKRMEIVSQPINSTSSPEIVYDENTRLVKCTDKDGNDYYVNCPEGTGNCCDLAPLPFIDLTSPEKQESFGSGNNHPDSTMSFKWPEDFNNSAYKDLKFEPNAILIGKDGKKRNVKFDIHPNYRFVVFKDISTDYSMTTMPAGNIFLTPFNGTYAGFNKPSIFVTMPQGSVKANMRPRLATSQASTKPGLKRLTPQPAPIGASVPLGEILFKNNGGGIKIDTAIVIYWPPVNGKDDYRQMPPPNNNMVVFSEGIVNNFKPKLETIEDRSGQLIISRKRAKHMRTWDRVIRTNSDNDNDEYNVAESINDTKNFDKSNLGVPIDTIQVIKWPEDFKEAAYKDASFEAMATFVAADGKFYIIDLDSDGDGFFDIDEIASKIPAGTMLLKRRAKSRTAINGNFHIVSFTKNGDTLPTYTMQIALPNGSNLEKLFEMSDQVQNYKMREIISLHIGQAGRQTTSNEKDIPIALPYFDTNGNLLFWATKDAITLTYEKNTVNISSIAKNNMYDMETFKAFYKTLINDNPIFAYPQFKNKPRRPRAVPHTESSIDPVRIKSK